MEIKSILDTFKNIQIHKTYTMNNFLRSLLLGLIIWAIPFFSSFFVWDVEANAPTISYDWFSSLMAVMWAIGFTIAIYLWIKNTKQITFKKGLSTGITWYIELVLLDLLFLVTLFGMSIQEFYPMILLYLNSLIIISGISFSIEKFNS